MSVRNAPHIDSVEARNQLAARALRGYAEGLRRRSKTRAYAGEENAEHRANLRDWAKAADELAGRLLSGIYSIDYGAEEIE